MAVKSSVTAVYRHGYACPRLPYRQFRPIMDHPIMHPPCFGEDRRSMCIHASNEPANFPNSAQQQQNHHHLHTVSNNGWGEQKPRTKYGRILLKVSGEALQGANGFGIDPEVVKAVAQEVKNAHIHGVEVAIVVGGGNYFRGASAWEGLERATADYVGMLATVMNALCLQGALENLGVGTRVQTAIEMKEIAEPYIRRRAIRHLDQKKVVIFGAGTGNPFFTTDTAAALRAAEVGAQVFMKATKVDGIYDSDPLKNPAAKRYETLSYQKVQDDNLSVMDQTAITLCKENNIPVIVFDVMGKNNVLNAALGKPVGTIVSNLSEQVAASS